MSPNTGNASLVRLKEQLAADNLRPVEPELAAELINKTRPMKLADATGPQERAATHADLLGRIRETDAMAWYRAQGLSENEIANLRRSALLSGMPNPTGSFLNNAMQYIVSPWINYATHQPWAGAGFGFATAAIAAPMNAAQQSAVVSLCESIREHGGHVIVPDKKQINDKHWLPALAKALESHIAEFSGCCDRFRALKDAADQNPAAQPTADFIAAAHQVLQAETRLHQAQHDFVMTQGAHERQWMGNRWQAVPRILRSPLSGTLGLLSKTGAMRALSPTAQTVGALLMSAVQHVAAGFDEQAKQDYNNKLNLLYADVLTDTGKAKLARGEPVAAEEIDQGKLRKLIQSPTQALVKRITSGLVAMEKELKAQVAAPRPAGDDRRRRPGSGSGPRRRPGKGAEIAEPGSESLARGQAGRTRSGRRRSNAAARLREVCGLGPTDRRYHQEVHFARVLGTDRPTHWPDVSSRRTGQRGVLGDRQGQLRGAGGTRNVPIPQALAISALSGGMAAVGALNQHTAITVKNNRREGDTDIGLKQQVLRGVMGAPTKRCPNGGQPRRVKRSMRWCNAAMLKRC